MPEIRHEGRTALVTGASSGIGRGIAKRFGEAGANVVNADVQRHPRQGKYYDTDVTRPTDKLIEEDTPGSGIYIETDVAAEASVKSMVTEAVDQFGGLDVLVNNAGIYIDGDAQSIATDEWDRVLRVNLDGVFLCAKFAIPHLIESSGQIINIASVHANEGGSSPPYASSKAAVENLTRQLAVELGGEGVNVNTINPGFIETPIQDYLTEEIIERVLEHTLVPRGGRPEDIGDMAVFLASERASFVHGESIHVDGGWTAHRGI